MVYIMENLFCVHFICTTRTANMLCSRCNNENGANAKFCAECGNALDSIVQSSSSSATSVASGSGLIQSFEQHKSSKNERRSTFRSKKKMEKGGKDSAQIQIGLLSRKKTGEGFSPEVGTHVRIAVGMNDPPRIIKQLAIEQMARAFPLRFNMLESWCLTFLDGREVITIPHLMHEVAEPFTIKRYHKKIFLDYSKMKLLLCLKYIVIYL